MQLLPRLQRLAIMSSAAASAAAGAGPTAALQAARSSCSSPLVRAPLRAADLEQLCALPSLRQLRLDLRAVPLDSRGVRHLARAAWPSPALALHVLVPRCGGGGEGTAEEGAQQDVPHLRQMQAVSAAASRRGWCRFSYGEA